jgi:hypothetical protein
MNAINKQILAIVLLACVAAGFPAYSAQLRQSPQARAFDIHAIKSYRGIPGVTDDEIRAIEALKASRAQFVYGSMPSTEAFTLPAILTRVLKRDLFIRKMLHAQQQAVCARLQTFSGKFTQIFPSAPAGPGRNQKNIYRARDTAWVCRSLCSW